VTPAYACIGDCDGSGEVAIGEMILAVGIVLGTEPLESCPAADGEDNGLVEVDDLLTIAGNALDGCHAEKELNTNRLHVSMPSFPIEETRICSVPIPIVVPRPVASDETGFGAIRMSVQSAERRDYDRVILVCEASH
jgi:hypothetical protein